MSSQGQLRGSCDPQDSRSPRSAERDRRGNDTTIFVGSEEVAIVDADVSIDRDTDSHDSEHAIGLGQQEYSGSFEVEFDDEFDALRFWLLFCGGAVS